MIVSRFDNSSQNQSLIQDFKRSDQDEMTIVCGVFLVAAVVGLVGNLIVSVFLGFKIQRNKYTVYIMNLSVADAILETVAIMALVVNINTFNSLNPEFEGKKSLVLFLTIVYYAMIYTGMYLLTAISMERCASTLFPIWNIVHRPRYLSNIMCCFAWVLGSLESLLDNFLCGPDVPSEYSSRCSAVGMMNFVLAVGICLPLMVISSFILLLKIKKTFRQRYPPKLYIIIIVAAIMFTLSVLPLNTLRFLLYCKLIPKNILPVKIVTPSEYWMIVNSAVNPYMYFLVGRKWNQCTCFSIHDTLLRAFTVDTANPNAQH